MMIEVMQSRVQPNRVARLLAKLPRRENSTRPSKAQAIVQLQEQLQQEEAQHARTKDLMQQEQGMLEMIALRLAAVESTQRSKAQEIVQLQEQLQQEEAQHDATAHALQQAMQHNTQLQQAMQDNTQLQQQLGAALSQGCSCSSSSDGRGAPHQRLLCQAAFWGAGAAAAAVACSVIPQATAAAVLPWTLAAAVAMAGDACMRCICRIVGKQRSRHGVSAAAGARVASHDLGCTAADADADADAEGASEVSSSEEDDVLALVCGTPSKQADAAAAGGLLQRPSRWSCPV
jgi:hypothetical protein